ncbi:putative peptidase (DUF1758) domain-containing protein [Phthorimaea operculella]|nr:putative peptidase (DUF1758) domain-containing protein [Phthorimaea operculella]
MHAFKQPQRSQIKRKPSSSTCKEHGDPDVISTSLRKTTAQFQQRNDAILSSHPREYMDKDGLTRPDFHAVSTRFEKFRELSFKFDEMQTQIEFLNSDALESELEIREEIENNIAIQMGLAMSILDTFEEAKKNENKFQSAGGSTKSSCSDKKSSCCNNHNKQIGFKLPILKISNFDGTFYKWLEFRDTFTSIIHNSENIEPIHKFHYLNSYLEGEASRVISNLEVSAANYSEAWRLLCERYNNEKQLITNHLNSLCNIQPVQRDSAKSLRFLIDHVSKHLRALKTLGEPTESWDTLIIHLISAKLDSSTSFKWEEHKCSIKGSPKLQDFFKFLKGRADIFESLQNNKTERQVNTKNNNSLYSSQPNNKNAKFSYNSNPINTNERSQPKYFAPEKPLTKCFAVMASNASSLACVLCNGSHRLYDCASFLAKSVEDRTAEAMRLKLCLVCLRSGHTSRQCKLGTCPISDCQSRHNRLLHKDSSVTANTSNVNTTTTYETEFAQESEAEDSSVTMTVYANKNNLLSTALVKVYNPNSNEYTTVRALLDAGSQSCLISEDLKNKLQLVPQATRVGIVGIGNVKSSHATQRLPNRTFDVEHLKIPTDLKLADPNFNVAAPADILIGVDVFWNLIEFGSAPIKLGPKQPMLVKTKLGWIVAGKMLLNSSSYSNSIQCNHLAVEQNCSSTISNEVLNDNLNKFWEIENIPQPKNQKTVEEMECESHFQNNTYRNEEGRFCVKLPLHTEPDCLGQGVIDFDRFSKLRTLQRSFAYVLRFLNNCRNPANKRTGLLQPEELSLSFEKLVRLSQIDSFNKELNILESNKPLGSNNPILSLSPYLDEKKVLRVGGRIDAPCYTYEKLKTITGTYRRGVKYLCPLLDPEDDDTNLEPEASKAREHVPAQH